jgi:hypothetical protein
MNVDASANSSKHKGIGFEFSVGATVSDGTWFVN